MQSKGEKTKALAFKEVKKTSATQRAIIFDYIQNNKHTSRRQVSEGLDLAINSVTARINELLGMGDIYESGIIKDEKTNKKVATLAVTEKNPLSIEAVNG